jgi:DNA-binding XRE family transcriptional regulator
MRPLTEKALDSGEFVSLRKRLQRTQREMAHLLGITLRAMQSFEQGWRKVPAHIERQLLFLWALKKRGKRGVLPCWEIRSCPPQTCQTCPAWEFKAGSYCWFINGTLCGGKPQESWSRKMEICRECGVFAANMKV